MTGVLAILVSSWLLAACGWVGGSPTSTESTAPPGTVPESLESVAVEPPASTSTAPGATAVWRIESPDSIQESSGTFTALVSRLGCSGGVTGEVFEPTIETGTVDITVTFLVAPLDPDLDQTCPGNDEVRSEVDVGEPIGERRILDGACRDGKEAAATSFCASGNARWTP